MFGSIVTDIDRKKFEDLLDDLKEKKGVKLDTELDAEDFKSIVEKYKELYKKKKQEKTFLQILMNN